jgi:phosphocarrier protein
MKCGDKPELTRTVRISNELGLHARAASKIARLAGEAHSGVFLIKNGQEVDGTDILDILSLYCPRGTEVTVRIMDPADRGILDSIARLAEEGFGET